MELWHFYHQSKQLRRDKISKSEAENWIKSLDYAEVKDWLCWKEGYTDWKDLLSENSFAHCLPSRPAVPPPPIPPPPVPVKSKSVPPPVRPEKKQSGSEQRREPRINIKLRAIITNKKNTFITFTKNISLSGILVESRIPQHIFDSDCEIYLIGPQVKESIVIHCKPVGNERNPQRLQFKEVSEKNLQTLKSWFDSLPNSDGKID